MVEELGRAHRRNVFGRAFLIQLQRGNLELARVFAKAFLLENEKEVTASPVEVLSE